MSELEFFPDRDDVSVTYVDIWRDGGTVSVVFTDSSGLRYPCCFGGALTTDSGRLFIGAIHPQEGPVQEVPLGGRIHQDVIYALKRHLNQASTPSELEAIAERDGSGGFRQGTSTEITPQDHKSWLLLDCIRRTEALTAAEQRS